jgi:hypothetical protein
LVPPVALPELELAARDGAGLFTGGEDAIDAGFADFVVAFRRDFELEARGGADAGAVDGAGVVGGVGSWGGCGMVRGGGDRVVCRAGNGERIGLKEGL